MPVKTVQELLTIKVFYVSPKSFHKYAVISTATKRLITDTIQPQYLNRIIIYKLAMVPSDLGE
jgi:hypothetical protein